MSILNTISLESNKKIKINFNGRNLSVAVQVGSFLKEQLL